MAGRPFGAKTVPYRRSLVRNPDRTYSVSVQVPAELRVFVGARELRFGLDTRDLEEATFLLPFVADDITQGMTRALAVKRQAALLEDPRGGFLEVVRDKTDSQTPVSEQILAEILAGCAPVHQIQYEGVYQLDDFETRKLLRTVDCLIVDFAVPLQRFTREYWRLVARVDRLRRQEASERARNTKFSVTDPAGSANGSRDASLLETITLFEVDFGHSWSPGTRRDYERAFAFLLELLGPDTSIRAISRQDLRRLRNILEDLASNWRKHPELKHLPLEKAAARSRELNLPRRSSKAITDTLDYIKVVMDFAVAEGLIAHNFAVKMHRGLPRHTTKSPYPFSQSQLQAIFHHPPLYDCPMPLEARSSFFWMPLLGLWTGMRLSECAQLRFTDIDFIDGIPVIRILAGHPEKDPRADKRVKTRHSTRVMPIHPVLERIGFVEYWRHAQQINMSRLFPDFLRTGTHHGFSKEAKQLTRFVRSATSGDMKVSFHSFRHTYRDAMRDSDLSTQRAQTLGGWGNKDTSDKYGIGGAVRRLYKDIKRIDFPELDLSHLYVVPPFERPGIDLPIYPEGG